MEIDKKIKVIYQNENILAIEKPAGIVTLPDENNKSGVFLELLLSEFPEQKKVNERGGILHRLDKDTSGLILVAKNKETFGFLKEAFSGRKVEKKYLALVNGNLKDESGEIKTLIGRSLKDRKKQKAFLLNEPEARRQGLRIATTGYKALKRLNDSKNNYTLIEASPKTGRKHQIRVHLSHIGHPIVADKAYGFKGQPIPKGLNRHFLHASYLKIELQNGSVKEFHCPLPADLDAIIKQMAET